MVIRGSGASVAAIAGYCEFRLEWAAFSIENSTKKAAISSVSFGSIGFGLLYLGLNLICSDAGTRVPDGCQEVEGDHCREREHSNAPLPQLDYQVMFL